MFKSYSILKTAGGLLLLQLVLYLTRKVTVAAKPPISASTCLTVVKMLCFLILSTSSGLCDFSVVPLFQNKPLNYPKDGFFFFYPDRKQCCKMHVVKKALQLNRSYHIWRGNYMVWFDLLHCFLALLPLFTAFELP